MNQSSPSVAQARQDSNLQPPVLETGALPIVLLAYRLGEWIFVSGDSRRTQGITPSVTTLHSLLTNHNSPNLPGFGVFGMLAAARAILLQPQAILHVLLVLARLVIALFAIATSHRQNGLIFVRHDNLDNLDSALGSITPAEPLQAADGI